MHSLAYSIEGLIAAMIVEFVCVIFVIGQTERRLGAALRAHASASPRAQISQCGVGVIRGVGFVVRLDERTSRESL
jgi:hypothetical protein